MKTCPYCNATLKVYAKFCSKCGQKISQKTVFPPVLQGKIDIEFTKERVSLERALHSFDGIFADKTLEPATNKELWENKKNWYSNQKNRFLQGNISNELFYNQLKNLNEYMQSTVKIPEDRLGLSLKNQITSDFSEGKLPKRISKKQNDVKVQISEPNLIIEPEAVEKMVTVTSPKESVSEEKRSLFTSIQYQVQDLVFEQDDTGPFVRIIPYSGSLEEIRVDFFKNQIIMSGCLRRQNLPLVNLELKINEEPRQPSWDDPWLDITLSGEERILKRIKLRSEIANRLASLGTALIKVESEVKGEICLHLTCKETQDAIRLAYSLLKDLQLFLEISFY
ncbi:MAG: zinc ribbon domain-containing protein [Promethearchaeota archaeon]